MRHEPIEFGLAGKKARARHALQAARGAGSFTKTQRGSTEVEVVDEAFAGFSPRGNAPLNRGLVAELSAQLAALDRQREQLSQLLRSIDADSVAT
jgi:hypothetical protein